MDPRFTLIGADSAPVAAGQPHAAVLDAKSGLMWAAHHLVPAATDDDDAPSGEMNHAEAEAAVAALDLAGFTDWRLPTVEELFAIADRSRHSPAIDTEAFPDTPSDWFWTSTPAEWNPSAGAWIVPFHDGYASTYIRDGVAFVRAVRSASPAGQ